MAVEPKRKLLALPSCHPASIQLYSPYTCALQELEVIPSNRVIHKDRPIIITPSTVVHATFDASGQWLATVDEREASLDAGAAVYLKLWGYNSKTATYTLNTRIDRPHKQERIVSVQFSPSTVFGDKLATAGQDGAVKVWGVWKSIKPKGEYPTHLPSGRALTPFFRFNMGEPSDPSIPGRAAE